jgi:polysaccharide export outer membrane protein
MVLGKFDSLMRIRVIIVIFVLSVLTVYPAGCNNKFWDPTQVGRFRPVPAVNVILDSLGVADETPSAWEGAEEPKPADILAYETDYVLGSGDVVRISIFELLQEETPYISDYVVTETGKISIPEVGVVDAAGLTESQLEEEIRRILSPTLLRTPSVTVTLLESQQRTFSILGRAVQLPGRYSIPRYDFRLTDALATGRVETQFNVSYVYVSRSLTGKEAIGAETAEPGVTAPKETKPPVEPGREMLEIIAPRAQRRQLDNEPVITSAEMATDDELTDAASPEGFESPKRTSRQVKADIEKVFAEPAKPAAQEVTGVPVESVSGRIEWIFQDGKWVPVQVGAPSPGKQTPGVKSAEEEIAKGGGEKVLKEKQAEYPKWEQVGSGGTQARVIKIPTDKLTGGDPRYNIVIRPGDSVQVPVDVIGEYYIMGNVNSQGFIDMTGRPLTLKMAIAAAGGLGPLAWPKKCEVIRRVSKKREEIVMVDLDKIAMGEQPDFFIKPNDLINVGTHSTARWRAVLRNAFRATYGFGFIYDRNFADRDFGTSRPLPNWF